MQGSKDRCPVVRGMQLDFPARKQLFLLAFSLDKSPDKAHFNPILKLNGKLDFRFFLALLDKRATVNIHVHVILFEL